MSNQITLTLEELQDLLNAQKKETAEYITRNLSVYSWFKFEKDGHSENVRKELTDQCYKSGYPNDFNILKKYLKP